MKISLIVAIGENREIGYQGKLLWKLKDDLQLFKKLTMGHHLVMGRKTYNTLPGPLPGRELIILSKHPPLPYMHVPGTPYFVGSIEEAIKLARSAGEQELFVVGGGEIYQLFLPLAERLYLTKAHATAPHADTFFPPYEHLLTHCIEQKEFPQNELNEVSFSFSLLELEKI